MQNSTVAVSGVTGTQINRIKKYGKIVNVKLNISGVPTGYAARLPEGYRPNEVIRFNANNYDSSGCVMVLMSCDTNGDITNTIPTDMNRDYLNIELSFIQ